MAGVGGLFDFFAGSVSRAPHALRVVGCEWMWRLAQEPRRMARRYLLGNLHFLMLASIEALRVRALSLQIEQAPVLVSGRSTP